MARTLYLAAALLAGCNLIPDDPSTTDTSDTETTDDPTSPSGPSIADVQQGVYADGDAVTLDGVIVSSPIDQEGEGFFIQDAGGGEWSGLYVFMQGGTDGLFLSEGDKLRISGTVSEFYGWTELAVSSVAAVEVTGTGTVTVDVVDPSSVADWEPWESCIIAVGPAEVTEGLNQYGEVVLDNGLKLDNLIYDFDTEVGATYTNVIGGLAYSFEEWKLSPRSAADLEGYVPGPGPDVVTVYDIQTGAATGEVRLEGVIATSGPDKGGDSFFVSDPAGGEYAGVVIYMGSSTIPAEVVPGAVLNIEGRVDEFDSVDNDGSPLTEVIPTLVEVTGTAQVPAPVRLTATPDDWEPYEGVLVELAGIEVTSEPDQYGESSTDWGIDIDDCFFDYAVSNGDNLNLIGLVTDFFGYKVCPRTQSDVLLNR